MDENRENLKKLIYDLMNGSLDLERDPVKESKFVENEFAEGKPCAKAYAEIFEANRRLCQRLGVEEDRDIEAIIDNFFVIVEYMSMKMYDYGCFFGKQAEE